jgi:hypothetical protein
LRSVNWSSRTNGDGTTSLGGSSTSSRGDARGVSEVPHGVGQRCVHLPAVGDVDAVPRRRALWAPVRARTWPPGAPILARLCDTLESAPRLPAGDRTSNASGNASSSSACGAAGSPQLAQAESTHAATAWRT